LLLEITGPNVPVEFQRIVPRLGTHIPNLFSQSEFDVERVWLNVPRDLQGEFTYPEPPPMRHFAP